MLSSEELDWLKVALQETNDLLRGMADFREYPDLLNRNDARLEAFLEHIVSSVSDARLLTSKALARIEDARAEATEQAREAVEAEELKTREPEPLPPPQIFEPPTHQQQIYMANPTGLREVVLVADHNQTTLAEIERILTEEDYRVLTVQDAFEAISIYARLWAAIDLVVLDFSMPGMNGDLIFDELQAINPKVAAVVTGGFTDPIKLNQMLGQGLKGYLPKPSEREKFLRQIQQVLAHRPHSSGGSKN